MEAVLSMQWYLLWKIFLVYPKFWSRKYTQSENVSYDSNQAERAYENPIKVESKHFYLSSFSWYITNTHLKSLLLSVEDESLSKLILLLILSNMYDLTFEIFLGPQINFASSSSIFWLFKSIRWSIHLLRVPNVGTILNWNAFGLTVSVISLW